MEKRRRQDEEARRRQKEKEEAELRERLLRERNECITDLFVTRSSDGNFVPEGFVRIDADLKKGSKGDFRYLCYKKGGDKEPITSLWVDIFHDHANP